MRMKERKQERNSTDEYTHKKQTAKSKKKKNETKKERERKKKKEENEEKEEKRTAVVVSANSWVVSVCLTLFPCVAGLVKEVSVSLLFRIGREGKERRGNCLKGFVREPGAHLVC